MLPCEACNSFKFLQNQTFFYSLNLSIRPKTHVGKRIRSIQLKMSELCTFEQKKHITFNC